MQDPTGDVGFWLIGTTGRPIAQVELSDDEKEDRDNARLLVLAPKFLAACLAYVAAERNGGVSMADLRTIAHRKIFDAVEEWNK